MGSYLQLFSIEIEHSFYTGVALPALQYVATEPSAALIRRRGLLVRSIACGLAVFYDSGQPLSAGADADTDADDAAMLAFKVSFCDPHFNRYTLPSATADALLYFDSELAQVEEDGRRRLHPREFADDEALQAARVPSLVAQHLDKPDLLMKPGFVLAIGLADEAAGSAAAPATACRYVLRFAANKSIWKYYFVSDAEAGAIAIVDLDNEIRFVAGDPVNLPGNRRALVFLTEVEIEMRQRYSQRFQLREQSGMGERVIIKRLPHANAGRVSREFVHEKAALVSEIYIN